MSVFHRWVQRRRGFREAVAAASVPGCLSRDGGWTCTMDAGHDGEHMAEQHGTGQVLARWPQQEGDIK